MLKYMSAQLIRILMKEKTLLMGILNVTPDSFHENSRALNLDCAIARGLELCRQGADILDIGGESTRPGADPVEEDEELLRVIPLIQALSTQIPIPISIDTRRSSVAQAALEAGATFINDVTGLEDPAMREVVASASVDVCVMHMQGTPQTMQQNPFYPIGVVPNLLEWFEKRIHLLIQSGIKEKHIILDPGIGFGKTTEDNINILNHLYVFKSLGFRVLLGTSRKTFLRKILNKPTSELLPATLAINTLALLAKVDILRVHDVKEHRDIIDVMSRFTN